MPATPEEIDAFIEGHLVHQDDALREAAGGIAVSPAQGKLLHLIARSIGARRVLELGTLYGYSAIWFARAGADVVTLELDPENAEVARQNVDRAGVGERVDIRVGPAIESLAGVDGPFDLAFLDADKAGMPEYFRAVLPLVRPGGLIIGDNPSVRGGAVIDGQDASAAGARRFYEVVAASDEVDATGIQTVGAKGHDGFVLAAVKAP